MYCHIHELKYVKFNLLQINLPTDLFCYLHIFYSIIHLIKKYRKKPQKNMFKNTINININLTMF